jgi:hypothetical protein
MESEDRLVHEKAAQQTEEKAESRRLARIFLWTDRFNAFRKSGDEY